MRLILFVVIEAVLAWVALGPLWRHRDSAAKDRSYRTLAGMVAGGLFIAAFSDATAKYHYVCTQEVNTHEGTECVGDYERVAGPDYGRAMLWTALGTFALRAGLNAGNDSDQDPSD